MEQLIIFVVIAFGLSFLEKRAKKKRLERESQERGGAPNQETTKKEVGVEDIFSSIFGVEKIEPETDYDDDEDPFSFSQNENTKQHEEKKVLSNDVRNNIDAHKKPKFNDAAFNIDEFVTEVDPTKQSTPYIATQSSKKSIVDNTDYYDIYEKNDSAACCFNKKTASLPFLQQAVIMKEVLDKPLSMRDDF